MLEWSGNSESNGLSNSQRTGNDVNVEENDRKRVVKMGRVKTWRVKHEE